MASLASRLAKIEGQRLGGGDPRVKLAEIQYDAWRKSRTVEDWDRQLELSRSKILGKPLTPDEEAELECWPQDPRAPVVDNSDRSEDELTADVLRFIEHSMSTDYHDVQQKRWAEALPRGHTRESMWQMTVEAFTRAEEWCDLVRALGVDPVETLHRVFPEIYRYYLRDKSERQQPEERT